MGAFAGIIFLLAGYSQLALAQTYPVQVITQLTPPYSVKLSDYTTATADRIAVNVFADIARPELQVKFRLRIEGQNVTITTKPEYNPPPVTIRGGMPERFTGYDLAEYFNPANLTFQGITRQQFMKTGSLPEGFYRFQLEVLEYNRGTQISNTGTANAWLILNDPPIVNLPRQDEKLKPQSPQNVLIQWTPRHTGSPNSAFATEYEVTMVEVWPSNRNPNDAILTSPPIFQTTTQSTTIVYGPAETPLEMGRRYAFRVRAKSMVGVEEMDLFKNNGYSEVVSFVYGDACDLPTGIRAESLNSTRFNVYWDGQVNHTGYKVRYRLAGDNTAQWFEDNMVINEAVISSLKADTKYEYQVAGVCGLFDGPYSTVATVTTKEEPPVEYSCGLPVETFNLDPASLVSSLKVGDIIRAGDFNVKLVKVSGGNGMFSGEGVIEMPYFNRAKVKAEFTSITVNKDLRMVNGYMNVTGAAVEVVPEGLKDLMDKLDEALDVIDSALTKIEENLPESFDPDSFVADTLIKVKDGIDDVYKDADGNVVIVDKNGNKQQVPAGTTAAIADDDGNGYLIDKKGNIHKTTADVAIKAGNREYNLLLKFVNNDHAHYGFDEQKHESLTGYETLENGYKVAWKSVASNASEVVTAKFTSAADLDASKIHFEMGGLPLQASSAISDDQSTDVTLTGKTEGMEEGLIAVYEASDTGKVQVLGKLNVVTYDEIPKTVVIVPVNDAEYPYSLTTLRDSLNRIYGQAVVKWSVEPGESIDGVSIGTPFDDGETGLLSNYTSDMRKVINAYEGDMDDDKLYLFLIGGSSKNNTSLAGYMPRSKQAGFIFVDQAGNEKQLIRSIAHELGHGAFNLAHTFNEQHFTLPEKSTDNLMDYAGGQKLYKFQWDKMRYPDIVLGLFEEDEDAQSVVVVNVEELRGWEYNDAAYAFLAPSGKVVLIPKTVKSLKFSTGDVANSRDANAVKIIPFGTLMSFNIEGTVYEAMWSEATNTFAWYAAKDKKYVLTEHIPLEKLDRPIDKIIIGIPVFSKGSFLYRVQLINNTFTQLNEVKAQGYLSGGTFQKFDFLSSFFSQNENVKTLSAPPSFFDNESAVGFVKYYLEKEKSDTPAYSLYLYTHATLLDKYNLLNSCFATGLPGPFLKNIEDFYNIVERTTMRGDIDPQGTTIKFPKEFELNDKTSMAFKYLMSKWSEVDVNYYKELEKIIERAGSIKISPEQGGNEISTEELLSKFSKYQDLTTDNFNCVFSHLSTENKRNFLKRLLSTSTDDLLNKYEKITLKILETLVSDTEVALIFQDLKANPKYLYNGYKKLNNFANGEYIDRLMYAVLRGWKQAYSQGSKTYPEFSNFDKEGEKEKIFNRIVNDPSIILLEDEKIFTGTKSNLILNTKWDESTYKITITQTDEFLNSYGKMLANLYTLGGASLFTGGEEDGKKLASLNPLDAVVIFISKQDVKDLGIQLEPGIYAVPAILIHWVNNAKESKVKQFYLRIGLDALAVALAPLTGGGSVALITLEIALPTIDVAMTVTKEQLSKNNETFYKVYEFWDKTYMVYGATLAGVGLFKSAPSLVSGSKNVMRLIAQPKVAGRLIRAKMFKNVRELKDLDIKKLADNIEELSKAILKNYANQWANYGYELNNLAKSIRLNVELRYVARYGNLDGFVNSSNDFLISNGTDIYSKVLKCHFEGGIHYASEIRFLKNSTNVKRIRFAAELENIRYTDNGKEMTSLLIVEDLDNPNSFFAVTEREFKDGIRSVENFDEVLKEYRAYKGIQLSRWEAFVEGLESEYPHISAKIKAWEDAALQEKFMGQFGEQADVLAHINGSNKIDDIFKTWQQIATDHQNLFSAFGNLTAAQKIKFLDDFAGSNNTILAALNGDVELVNVWSDLGSALNATDAKDIAFLTSLKGLKSNHSNIWNRIKTWNDAALQRKFMAQFAGHADVLTYINGSNIIDNIIATWKQIATGHPNLFSAFGNLTKPEKIKFLDDFAGCNNSVLRALEGEIDLLDGWKEVQYLHNFRKDIDFLKALKKVKTDNVWKHIEGEVYQPSLVAVGGHHLGPTTYLMTDPLTGIQYITNGKIRFKPSDILIPNPYYTGMEISKVRGIEIFDGTAWQPKNGAGLSSLFHSSWTKQQIIEETALAFSKAKQNPHLYWDAGSNGNVYKVMATDGTTEIKLFYGNVGEINPLSSGITTNPKVKSSFPNN